MRRVRRRLPGELSHDRAERQLRRERDTAEAHGARAQSDAAPVRVRAAAADQAADAEGREHLHSLRPVRRALPDRRVGHAQVRPADPVCGPAARGRASRARTAGGCRRGRQMTPTPRQQVNDFAFKIATVNGTGSSSANDLIRKAIFRMGVPVSGKNIFPSNIQGLPTWYEIRVNAAGHTARTPDFDLMIAMNPATYARDIAEVRP